MILAIFLVLAWFGLVLVLSLVQILDTLSETVPMIPQTCKTGLKDLIYSYGQMLVLEFFSSEKSEKLFLK